MLPNKGRATIAFIIYEISVETQWKKKPSPLVNTGAFALKRYVSVGRNMFKITYIFLVEGAIVNFQILYFKL